jgi:DNA mismatch repair protein MutS2
MNDHTLTVLEFDRLLELICQQAQSQPGMTMIRALRPRRQLAEIQARRGLYEDMLAVRACPVDQPGLHIEDLSGILREVAPEGAVLAGQDLLAIRGLLETVAQVAAFVQHRECENFTHLRRLAAPLEVCADLHTALLRSLDVDGTVMDSASERLHGLRRQVAQMEQRIQRHLDALVRSSETENALQDKFVTVRNGRYVVPVRRDARNALPGLVHDLSNSGQTLFVEPTATLAWGNDLTRLRLEERDEVRRILANLSAQVRRQLDALRADMRIIAEMDAAAAVARWAILNNCVLPGFGGELCLKQARHPLLLAQFRQDGQGRTVVPLDLELPPRARTLVITGSNTGGKTVALKTIGLLCLAAQSGLPVPAAAESLFPVYDAILADIGDEQSIQANLSTFSAHVKNIGAILHTSARGRALVLLDELGSGTDPLEGGALACGILSELYQRHAFVIATTHLGAVKNFVHDHAGMINAAVRFNVDTLAPEYTLDVGRPGASHALLIARRIGLPEGVLNAAEGMLSGEQLRLEDMLTKMEADQRRISTHAEKLADTEQEMTAKRDALRQELDSLRQERKKLLHDANRQAAAMVENTRREMENLVRELRENAKRAQAGPTAAPPAETPDKTGLERLRQALADKERRLQEGLNKTAPRNNQPVTAAELVPGRKVWVEKLQAHGILEGLFDDGAKAALTVNGVLFTTRTRDLQTAREPQESTVPTVRVTLPRTQGATPSEVNLIGQRVEEAIDRLDAFINQSILAHLPEVRVVHGFGTGRLRHGIHAWLRQQKLIKSYRLGKDGVDPGGSGCTIITL